MVKHPKRPRDPMQRAKLIMDIATREAPSDPRMVPETLAMAGKRKGGKADHVWSPEEIAGLPN